MSVTPADPIGIHRANDTALAAFSLRSGGAGLVVGLNSQNAPVTAALFGPEPTRVALIGSVRCAQLLAFRALAIGARLSVRSTQQGVWSAFLRATGVQPHEADLLPPHAPFDRATSATSPQLVIDDIGSSATSQAQDGAGWRAIVTVRTELAQWDLDALARADLVIMQPLTPMEASLAASALGLDSAVQRLLSEIRADVVTLVSRGTPRWVLLAPTQIESSLIGPVARG